MDRGVVAVAACAILFVLTSPATANDDLVGEPVLPPEPPALKPMSWKWRRFQTLEYVATGVLLASTVTLAIFKDPNASSNWEGPILFDGGVRGALRLSSAGNRKTAQALGDAMYYAALVYPAVVDVVAVTWIGHGAADTAGQMALIDTEAFAITGLLSFVSNATIRRARPYLRECAAGKPDPRFPPCEPAGQSESFFSGHTGIAFTGAMLTCMHHAHLPLYGRSRVGGTIVCGSMMAGATATGVARIMGDKHYASDVLVGAAIGLASGFLVPWLHYRGGPQRQATGSIRFLPAPFATPSGGGMGVVGFF